MTACRMARRVGRSPGLQRGSGVGGLEARAAVEAASRGDRNANDAERGCRRTLRQTRAWHLMISLELGRGLAAGKTLAGRASALMAGPEPGWSRLGCRGQKRTACRQRLQGPQPAAASSQNDERTHGTLLKPCAQLPRDESACKVLECCGCVLTRPCEGSCKGTAKEQINFTNLPQICAFK